MPRVREHYGTRTLDHQVVGAVQREVSSVVTLLTDLGVVVAVEYCVESVVDYSTPVADLTILESLVGGAVWIAQPTVLSEPLALGADSQHRLVP
jgi:hypothetical protein